MIQNDLQRVGRIVNCWVCHMKVSSSTSRLLIVSSEHKGPCSGSSDAALKALQRCRALLGVPKLDDIQRLQCHIWVFWGGEHAFIVLGILDFDP
jgi:hypothetical protein